MAIDTLARVASTKNRAGRASPKPAEVRQLRESAGLTQTQFGELAHKSLRIAQDWESGERNCPPDTWDLIKIKLKARALVKRGRIAPQVVKDLGIELPETS